MSLTAQSLDDLDFALARGGVSASVGLRHLLNSTMSLNLVPVQGLTVGWYPYHKAVAMAAAYRSAIQDIKTEDQREMINSLTIGWMASCPGHRWPPRWVGRCLTWWVSGPANRRNPTEFGRR